MTVELTAEELERVIRLIERELSELGPEIRHTQTTGFRADLKADKKMLQALVERLRHCEAA